MNQYHKERGIAMRVIVTNNEKVKTRYSGKIETIMVNNSSSLNVFREGLTLANKGGRLLIDPSRCKGYYKSLPFFMEEGENTPDHESVTHLNKCIDLFSKPGINPSSEKEPLFSGILQNRDLGLLQKILG